MTGVQTCALPISAYDYLRTGDFKDAGYGTPRTSNETRPKTAIMFKYIKAEYVTTAGEPISALRYIEEVATNDFKEDRKSVV